MEQQEQCPDHPAENLTVHPYDAVPRDGPAVFVADCDRLDRGDLHGAWIGLDQSASAIAAGISEVTGRAPVEGGWAIVDQVRLGGVMCEEDIALDVLTRMATLRQGSYDDSPPEGSGHSQVRP